MDRYEADAEATAAAFRGGWFHTGDLGRMDDAGRVYLVGRLKDMIRRAGENVSAREVEDVLLTHRSVRLAAVVAVPDELRGEEVKAFVSPAGADRSEQVLVAELAEHCGQRLARFKVPRYWEVVRRPAGHGVAPGCQGPSGLGARPDVGPGGRGVAMTVVGPACFRFDSAVYFDEMDPLGVMHNSRFAVHVERAQSALFEHSATAGPTCPSGTRTSASRGPRHHAAVHRARVLPGRHAGGGGRRPAGTDQRHVGVPLCRPGPGGTESAVAHGTRVVVKVDGPD